MTAHGFHDATTDENIISNWWANCPAANIGIRTGDGLVVLDVDEKNGKHGWQSLAAIGITRVLLEGLGTYMVTSPSGGSHFWFHAGEAVRCGTDVLGLSGVDIRGDGGYIVVPPSCRPEGHYVVSSCGMACAASDGLPRLSRLADWGVLGGKIRRPVPPTPPPPSAPREEVPTSSEVVERARLYLAACPPAISGHGGHDQTFAVASVLVNGFLLPTDVALELLREYNRRCVPSWSEKELNHKVTDAEAKGPPEGKPSGWLLAASPAALDSSDGGDLPVVEVEESDATDEESGGAKTQVEKIEGIPFPEGIVGKTARWIEDRSAKPFRPFAIASALAVWGTLAGRKVRYQNQGPQIYALFVCASSNGKDAPLMLPKTILSQIGVPTQHTIGRITSWNAAHEKLSACWLHPVMLSVIDEGAGYFNGLRSNEYGALDYFKAIWSRAEGSIEPQGRVKKSGSLTLEAIHRPAWSMLMGAQPRTLGRAVGTEQLEDGLLPRMLCFVRDQFVVDIAHENLNRTCDLKASSEGREILERGKQLWSWLDGMHGPYLSLSRLEGDFFAPSKDVDFEFREVWTNAEAFQVTPKADEVFRDFVLETQKRIKPAAEGRTGPLGFLWGKAAENAKRIALILAAARCGGEKGIRYIIEGSEAQWAVRFVEASVWSGIEWARKNMADTLFQRQTNDVLHLIEGSSGGTIKHSELHRKLRYSLKPHELADVLTSLKSGGTIEQVSIRTKGRAAAGYRICGRRR